MNDIKQTQILAPLQETGEFFRTIVREELAAAKEKDLHEKYLSPEEVCNLFVPKITKPTLASYVDKGLVTKHYFGGRTWFRYSEILQTLKPAKDS